MQNTTTVALSRMIGQQRAMDVTANNIANATTPGFRGERLLFSDFLFTSPRRDQPRGAEVLTFAQDRATYRDTMPGPLNHTANPFDFAIASDGYFTVQTANGVRLTRAGHFTLSADGSIVDSAGNALLDNNGQPLRLAAADTTVTVSADGTIGSENGRIGRIAVVRPTDPFSMRAEGARLYATDKPTEPVERPKLVQGAVENSNVTPTLEMTRMIREMREFEFTSKLIQAEADRQQSAIDKITQKRS